MDIERFLNLVERAVRKYPAPVVDLIAVQTRDAYRVLVAAVLSARTRDQTTARAARRLFAAAPDLDSLARLDKDAISRLIYPVGFYQNKAGYLVRLAEVLREQFNSQIPAAEEELLTLPGVGRKTANLVAGVAFGRPAICVDTHVHRIMNIRGYVATETPLETEKALRRILPEHWWRRINPLLVAFGQSICLPRRPCCDLCPAAEDCPRNGVTPRKKTSGEALTVTNHQQERKRHVDDH